MRVLVTGGAGFIGSNIAQAALERGFCVRVLDNLSPGSLTNLKGLDVEFVNGDVVNEKTVDNALKDVDYVFHEAATSSSPMFDVAPQRGVSVNIQGFLNVLHYGQKNGVQKVVYAMTSTMYGNTPSPWKETGASAERCPNMYAFSLFARSSLARIYKEQHGVQTVGLVYFSVYGPHERAKGKYANIISQFIWSMGHGERPILYGDGSQTRDFVHVHDVAEANLLAAESKISGEIVNVGSGKATAMNEVVEEINRLVEKKLEPIYMPNPIHGYVYHTLADTEKARQLLDFKPKISVKEGIGQLVSYYNSKNGY